MGAGIDYTVSGITTLLLCMICTSCTRSPEYIDVSSNPEEEAAYELVLDSNQPVAMTTETRLSTRTTFTRRTQELRVACSGGGQEWFMDLVKPGFEKSHPGFEIHMFHPRPEQGLQELIRGNLDLVLTSLPLSYAQKKQGLRQIVIDRKNWVVIVNPTNPIHALSKTQVGEILDGRIHHWSAIGKLFTDMETFHLAKDEPSQKQAWHLLFPELELEVRGQSAATWADVVSRVSKASGGIAIVPLEEARSSRVKLLAIDGKRATWQALTEGSYPLSFDLTLAYSVDSKRPARELRDYMMKTKSRPAAVAGPGR